MKRIFILALMMAMIPGFSMQAHADLNLIGQGTSAPGGYHITTSEMGHLFYTELGNIGYWTTDGTQPQPGWGLTNTGDFQNLQPVTYYSGTEYSANPGLVWHFRFDYGDQDPSGLSNTYALAVRSGLAVVPEPMSMILFGTGCVVLAERMKLSRRRHG